jgi:methyltransferase
MTILYAVLLFVVVQRLVELVIAKRNTTAILAAGGIEHGVGHYPLIVLLHLCWLASLAYFISPDRPVNVPLLSVFVVLQLLRVWVLCSLGNRWTTRVFELPGQKPIATGPYRWVRHPNYIVVAGEILVLPLAFGAWDLAAIFSVLNGLVLWHRIRVENVALNNMAGAANE